MMVCSDFPKGMDPAYLSNGLIGIRPGPNPLAPAFTAVSGYVYRHPILAVECLAPAPYPLATEIIVGETSMSADAARLTTRSQALDMSTGELVTDMQYEPRQGLRIAISVLQFASRSTPSLVCQEITIASNSPVGITVMPRVAAEAIPGRLRAGVIPQGTRDVDAAAMVDAELSQLGVALAAVADPVFRREGQLPMYRAEVEPGQKIRLRTIAALVSSCYHPFPDLQAIRMVSWGRMLGFDNLRLRNQQEWKSLWTSRVRVDADADAQRALDAAFFYLHSSVHRSNRTGMPPFGLSQTEHYYGHSFWDTETMSLLPVLLASPEAARALLEFRMRGLGAARRVASLYGYRGAQFPWEAAQIDGAEATPTFADTGWSEQHVVPDVALAFWQYQMATGDTEFVRTAAWPVLKAVAEWIESRGEFTARGYEIRHIMGPNEGVNNIDNNTYVNASCAAAMRAAIRCAEQVRYAPPAVWTRIASTLVLPRDANTGVVLAYDGSRQDAFPDLSFLLPFDPVLPPETLERAYASFKQRKPEYMIGFATAAIAAATAFVGDRKAASDLFQQCWRPSWMPPFGMTKEVESQTYGCFLTNFGSMLQCTMIGFTGLRIQEGDWAKYPATLPEGWKSIEVDRIWVRGEPKRLIAVPGRKSQILDT